MNNFEPEIESDSPHFHLVGGNLGENDHRHAAIGLSAIVLLTGTILSLVGWGVGLARADRIQPIDNQYFISRAKVLAEFQPDEKPVEPNLQYFLPGAKLSDTVRLGDAVRQVVIIDPNANFGGVVATFTAPEYKIQDSKKTYTISNFKRVVGDILAQGGVKLAIEDIVEPPRAASAPADNKILITRVEVAEIQEHETLPYQQKKIDDPNLDRGKKTVSQKGKTGLKTLTYRVRREDGVEVSKTLIKTETDPEPQTEIIKVGTRIVVLSSISGEASWTKGATAMRRYKKGILIRVTNKRNGKSVETRVGGWGPMEYTGRILDLEQSAFEKIADLDSGTTDVLVEEIKE